MCGLLTPYVLCRLRNCAVLRAAAEQRQQQGGAAPSIEGISGAARAAKAAYLGPLLRPVLAWTQPPDPAVARLGSAAGSELRDACL